MLDGAQKPGQDRLDVICGNLHGLSLGLLAVSVERIGRDAEPGYRQVFLGEILNEPDQPRGAAEGDDDALFDVKVVYQQGHQEIDINAVPQVFKPTVGPFGLTDYNKVFGTLEGNDIFDVREIDRSGAVVVVRPDQYVAHVLPLDDTAGLAAFFDGFLLEP